MKTTPEEGQIKTPTISTTKTTKTTATTPPTISTTEDSYGYEESIKFFDEIRRVRKPSALTSSRNSRTSIAIKDSNGQCRQTTTEKSFRWHSLPQQQPSPLPAPRAVFACAPMVDQSELAFRQLVRRHNVSLCYSPMLNAGLFASDAGYRRSAFSTCPSDRPLVVQFCANDPQSFISAATLVQHNCDAVDLNLGCPQNIAKVGRYGAFLQDDWDTISEIVFKAKNALRVPVFCKIRVFDDVNRTVAYAQMLEKAGCALIAVHGRTRQQKGQDSGLASWDQIRAVVNAVRIPVLANGNVQCFEDVERCLEATGAAGVMSAEGLLRNPALFSGRASSVPLLTLVREYLHLAQIYRPRIRTVRSHLFRMLKYVLEECVFLQTRLAKFSSLEEIRNFVDRLELLEGMSYASVAETSTADFLATRKYITDGINGASFRDQQGRIVNERNRSLESSIVDKEVLAKLRKERRIARREGHHERVLAARRAKRKEKKDNRTRRIREEREQMKALGQFNEHEYVSKRILRKISFLRLQEVSSATSTATAVCIDLGLCKHMNSKEIGKLCSQIRRIYGINRKSSTPLDLNLINFSEDTELFRHCVAKNEGFRKYQMGMYQGGVEEVMWRRRLTRVVYLSPDAKHPLEGPLNSKTTIYVIGGLIDETIEKNISLKVADCMGAYTYRLPIREHLVQVGGGSHSTVLTVNQVAEILLRVQETAGDWATALAECVPKRKGFIRRDSR